MILIWYATPRISYYRRKDNANYCSYDLMQTNMHIAENLENPENKLKNAEHIDNLLLTQFM